MIALCIFYVCQISVPSILFFILRKVVRRLKYLSYVADQLLSENFYLVFYVIFENSEFREDDFVNSWVFSVAQHNGFLLVSRTKGAVCMMSRFDGNHECKQSLFLLPIKFCRNSSKMSFRLEFWTFLKLLYSSRKKLYTN